MNKSRIISPDTSLWTNSGVVDSSSIIEEIESIKELISEFEVHGSILLILPVSNTLFYYVHAAFELESPFILMNLNQFQSYKHSFTDSIKPDIIVTIKNQEIEEWAKSFKYSKSEKLSNDIAEIYINRSGFCSKFSKIKADKKDIAYIMFTSGSTGVPKPVAISRNSLNLYNNWYSECFSLEPNDKVIIACSSGFDMIINALFPPAIAGADIIIPSQKQLMNPEEMLGLIKQREVTLINFTPSYSELLLSRSKSINELPSLRIVEFGGEKLTFETAREWKKIAKNADLYNCYGVAEATVTSLYYKLEEDDYNRQGVVPLKDVVDCINIELTGKNSNTGNLQISGSLVGLGYLDQKNDNSSPFEVHFEKTSYKTGDLFSLDESGYYYYKGRIDKQIKLPGGIRFNLSEIDKIIPEKLNEQLQTYTIAEQKNGTAHIYSFCIKSDDEEINKYDLIERVNMELPKYAQLREILFLDTFPVNSNGKVDESALLNLIHDSSLIGEPKDHYIFDILKEIWEELLSTKIEDISNKNFFNVGGTSFSMARLISSIEDRFNIQVDYGKFLQIDTFQKQLRYIYQLLEEKPDRSVDKIAKVKSTTIKSMPLDKGFSIIGVGVLTPQFSCINEFKIYLENNRTNRNLSSRFSGLKNDIGQFCFPEKDLKKIISKSTLSDEEKEVCDPQYLVWEQVVKQAIDSCSLELSGKRVGVYLGMGPTFFSGENTNKQLSRHSLIGTTPSFAAGIISHQFDFNGPSLVVDTACSSSLVAVHLAMQALKCDEIDIAIAGGVQLFNKSHSFDLIQKAGINSEIGVCRPFDIEADGYVPGEGAAAIILSKNVNSTEKAYGFLRNSVVNHDGNTSTKTLPNIDQQQDLYKSLLEKAEISINQISFIEAHGTGTPIGDPIEIKAIENFFSNDISEPIFLGSVKGLIGHTHYAAGILGLIKALIQLRENTVYKQPNINKINKYLNGSKIKVPLESTKISQKAFGVVNSFGFSGTNCSVLISSSRSKPQSDMIREDFIKIIATKLDVNYLELDLNLSAIQLGLDSLDCVDIASEIGRQFDIDLSPSLLLEYETLNDALDSLQTDVSNESFQNEPMKNFPGVINQNEDSSIIDLELEEIDLNNNLGKVLNSENDIFKKIIGPTNNGDINEKVLEVLIKRYSFLTAYYNNKNSVYDNLDLSILKDAKHSANIELRNTDENSKDRILIIAKEKLSKILDLPTQFISNKDSFKNDLGLSSIKKMEFITLIVDSIGFDIQKIDNLLASDSLIEFCEELKKYETRS